MISVERSNATLGYEFGKRTFTPPSSYFLRLSLTPITTDTIYTEPPSSIGYAPVEIPNDTDNWSEPANRIVTNLLQHSFPIFTDTPTSSDPIVYWFLTETDAANAPAKYWNPLAVPIAIQKDSQIWVNPGELKLQRDNPA